MAVVFTPITLPFLESEIEVSTCLNTQAWRIRSAIRILVLYRFVTQNQSAVLTPEILASLADDAKCLNTISWRQRYAIRIGTLYSKLDV